jgi:hypothetical protein
MDARVGSFVKKRLFIFTWCEEVWMLEQKTSPSKFFENAVLNFFKTLGDGRRSPGRPPSTRPTAAVAFGKPNS